jgi:hypothetical protein
MPVVVRTEEYGSEESYSRFVERPFRERLEEIYSEG